MQGLCGRICQMIATSSFFKALPFRSFGAIALNQSLSYTCNLEFPLRQFHMESNKKSESGGAFTVLGSISKCSLRQVHMESNNISDPRGSLIVLEGLDRCGKTSQCSRLLSYLEELGHSVESWRFPDRNTGVGQMISSYLNNNTQLDDHAIHLLFSANRWEKRSLMESKLRSGITLIVDRYSFSGVAFSSSKGLDMDWCKAPEAGLLAPDLVLYLDISPEKAAERGGYGGERYEHLEFQKKVALSYQKFFDSTWKIVDATLPVEDVEKQLKEIVKDCILTCQKGKPVLELWQN